MKESEFLDEREGMLISIELAMNESDRPSTARMNYTFSALLAKSKREFDS